TPMSNVLYPYKKSICIKIFVKWYEIVFLRVIEQTPNETWFITVKTVINHVLNLILPFTF
ncbi:hypothetical protein, partial [Nostoc sp. CALU 546]|uniref:hypothetical protein n=1 Tax=Nostoc sp. CALU 546 TaxID=1867241 RepID=UPI003B6785FB